MAEEDGSSGREGSHILAQCCLGKPRSSMFHLQPLPPLFPAPHCCSPPLSCSYGQALAAVLAARGELERLGVPHRRPDDYFAEMIKSDEHMQKVKDRLVFEQKKITAVENRKKERLTAKYTKQVAIEKMKAKAADRKAQLDALSSWRKNKNGKRPDLSTEAELNAFLSNATGGAGADGGAAAGGRTGGSNRKAKDRKFGFGIGNKKMRKENTAASSHSTKGFSMGRNRSLPPGMQSRGGKGGAGGGFKGGKNAGGSRPGKQARQSMRGKGRR